MRGINLRKVKLNKDRCVSCHTCEIACAEKHSNGGTIEEIYSDSSPTQSRLHIVMRKAKLHLLKCVHCKKPKCLEVCEEGAIYKQDDGVVTIDYEKCTGCWSCIDACPFNAIFKDEDRNVPIRCDLCVDLEVPACVTSCQTQALTVEEGEAEFYGS
jgi:carbon-monoxide dehydrogenase iron sulfur subunit